MSDTANLVINADDFGLSESVNQAVLACYYAGSLSSATLMVNQPGTSSAVQMARENPGLGVGLHVNLTLGEPVADKSVVQSLLTNNGEFFRKYDLEKRLLLGLVKSAEIELEVAAQIDKFLSYGIPMTHIDGHDHIHMFPRVFSPVSKYALMVNIPVRVSWVNSLGVDCVKSFRRVVRRKVLEIIISMNRISRIPLLKYNKTFSSVFEFVHTADEISVELYIEILKRAGQHEKPFELMVHPYTRDDTLADKIRILDYCNKEYEILTSMNLGEEARKYGLILGRYDEVF